MEQSNGQKTLIGYANWVLQTEGAEQVVWREVFYRPIQEFQRRLRHAFQAGDAGREALRKVPSLPTLRDMLLTLGSGSRLQCGQAFHTIGCAVGPGRARGRAQVA